MVKDIKVNDTDLVIIVSEDGEQSLVAPDNEGIHPAQAACLYVIAELYENESFRDRVLQKLQELEEQYENEDENPSSTVDPGIKRTH